MAKPEIFPQSIILYPGDVQRFTLRSTPPPALWTNVVNATIQADGTLSFSSPAPSARGGHMLMSGTGSVVFTADARMLPTSTGKCVVILKDGTREFRIEFGTSNTVGKKEGGVTLFTSGSVLQAATDFRLEAAGTIFRLFMNEQLQGEYTTAAPITYPVRYEVEFILPALDGSPHFVAPDFGLRKYGLVIPVGDWRIPETIPSTWLASGGTISPSSNTDKVDYMTGNVPGGFQLSNTIGGSGLQGAAAAIFIPTLAISGPNQVTLQPGEKVRFKTNYDNAQKKLVTWSIVSGGGSFSNGEFTAPSTPGTTVVRASATSVNSQADITITVPAVITANVTGAATLGEVVTFSTNMTGTINWTADLGSPLTGTGANFAWTAPNQAGLVARITATNGTFSVAVELPVLEKFAYDPTLNIPWDRKKTVLISRAEDRSRSSRVKDKGGLAFEAFEFTFRNRDLTELNAVHAFWDKHYPQKRWIYEDKLRNVRKVLYFDSDIRQEAGIACDIDYSFRAVEG